MVKSENEALIQLSHLAQIRYDIDESLIPLSFVFHQFDCANHSIDFTFSFMKEI